MDCCPSFHWGLSGQLSLEAEEWELALLNSTNEAPSTDPVSWKRVTAVALPPCSQQRERKKREGKKEREGKEGREEIKRDYPLYANMKLTVIHDKAARHACVPNKTPRTNKSAVSQSPTQTSQLHELIISPNGLHQFELDF